MLDALLLLSLTMSIGISVIMNILSYSVTSKLSVGYTIFGIWSVISVLVLIS